MRRLLLPYLVASLTGLGACATVGPNYRAPDANVPVSWGPPVAISNDVIVTPDPLAEPDPNWWHAFHDPLLDSLEKRAASGNLDLQEAIMRISEARSQEHIARAQGLPNLKATAAYEREQLGLEGILKAKGGLPAAAQNNPEVSGIVSEITKPINLFTVALDASWELDLFGKVSRSVEAANAQTDSARQARNGALVALQAEVAQDYVRVRAAQALRELTRSAVKDEREVLELTQSRNSSGLASESEVQSIVAQLSQNEADLPQYEVQSAVAQNEICVLLGIAPGQLTTELDGPGRIFDLPQLVPIGLPAALARRRPDIAEAEANLHAATAQTGVAVASLFPDISLGAQYGLRNTTTKYLFNWASRFYNVGPTVSLPIFQGGALVANIHLARAEQEAAALEYRKTVLQALEEVQNALVSFAQDQLRTQSLRATLNANQRSLDLSRDAYRHGIATYISVLDSDRQTIQTRTQFSSALVQESADLITLYKALGGGWQTTAGAGAGGSDVPSY